MKKKILSLIFSVLLATGFTTSSNASIIEGLGIGVSLGTAGYYGVGTESSDNDPTGVDDTKQAGAMQADWKSVFVEYNLGPIKVGVDYHFDTIESPQNKNIQGSLTNTVQVEFENHTTGYIMLPIWGMLYAKAGVIYVDIATKENLATGGSYGDVDTTGALFGLGLNHDLDNGLSIRAEASAQQYDDVSATNSNNTSIKVDVTDMMGATARVSLVKTF
tara:strand:- start:130 stop:783 length:654 start_codon:yes stop_codon:yes gene_type:complete